MRRAWISAAAALLIVAHGHARWSIEADLNGFLGDPQPDFVVVAVGQEVTVDFWVVGAPDSASGYHVVVCSPGGLLGFSTAEPYPPLSWSAVAIVVPDSAGCLAISAYNFGFAYCPLDPPHRIAKVVYEAAVDHSIAEVTLGTGSAYYTWRSYEAVSFCNNGSVIARIQIGDVTATETTSWGSIKALFR